MNHHLHILQFSEHASKEDSNQSSCWAQGLIEQFGWMPQLLQKKLKQDLRSAINKLSFNNYNILKLSKHKPSQTNYENQQGNVRIINPQFTHLDINSIIFVLFAQFMCPTLCKLSITYPQWSNLPNLTHVALGKPQGINSTLFLVSQAPFCFFCFIACFFSALRQLGKFDQVRLTSQTFPIA